MNGTDFNYDAKCEGCGNEQKRCEEDKSTEFMLQYMQDVVGVDLDCVIAFLRTHSNHETTKFYQIKNNMDNKELKHLEWVYARLNIVHKENENVDYMIRFRQILDKHAGELAKNHDPNECEDGACPVCAYVVKHHYEHIPR